MQSTSEDAENSCDAAIYATMNWAERTSEEVTGDWSPSQLLQAAQLVHLNGIHDELATLTAALERVMPMLDNPATRFFASRKKQVP